MPVVAAEPRKVPPGGPAEVVWEEPGMGTATRVREPPARLTGVVVVAGVKKQMGPLVVPAS